VCNICSLRDLLAMAWSTTTAVLVLQAVLQIGLAFRVEDNELTATRGCKYTKLSRATVKRTGAHVAVAFCNDKKTLSLDGISPVFADVEWLDRSLEGKALSATDLDYINKYTGSYKYAKNIGTLFRGIVPGYPNWERMDETFWNVGEEQYDELVKKVLDFGVGLGTALNKIRGSPTKVWRGGWENKDKLRQYEDLARNQGVLRNSWFQSTTVDRNHSYNFLHPQYMPAYCKDKCQDEGKEFPVHFEYSTTVAKDVREWNAAESEMIILPNSPFKVVSVAKTNSDPLSGLSNDALRNWLSSNLAPGPNLDKFLAKIKSDSKMDGDQFAKQFRTSYVQWVSGRYQMAAPDDAYAVLRKRFFLPMYKDVVANDSPYYYKVLLKDA